MIDQQARKIDSLWSRVVSSFRNACFLRHHNDLDESMRILNNSLPHAITSWSELDKELAKQKRLRLTKMFEEEEKRMEDAFVISDVLSSTLVDTLIPQLSEKIVNELSNRLDGNEKETTKIIPITTGIRERVPMGDVAAMIDSLLDNELKDKRYQKVATA